MKMHKLVHRNVMTYCRAWLMGHEGYWATQWWKYTTCKTCLKFRKRTFQVTSDD